MFGSRFDNFLFQNLPYIPVLFCLGGVSKNKVYLFAVSLMVPGIPCKIIIHLVLFLEYPIRKIETEDSAIKDQVGTNVSLIDIANLTQRLLGPSF